MDKPPQEDKLPAPLAAAISGIPAGLIPASIKALDRLIGAAVDIPVAWLAQKKAQIDAQTEAFMLVEGAIAAAAASEAGADLETVQNAVNVLVRKSYRKHVNRGAVAAAMVEDLRGSAEDQAEPPIDTESPAIEDDWLNVFERYAEDASSERMQNLWGRVLAGEIRKPGRYSTRTLRFLSEFSQADGLLFSDFCKSAFGDAAPNALIKPAGKTDVRSLLALESAGLIQGADGLGLTLNRTFNDEGNAFVIEGDLAIWFQGKAGSKFSTPVCALTPLGQELLSLLPGRDRRSAARAVAHATRCNATEAAFLARVDHLGNASLMEILWQTQPTAPPS